MKHFKLDLNSESDAQGKPWDFSCIFTPPIQVSSNAEVALSSARIWNSLKNISSTLNNNVFRYWNGSLWRLLNIAEGTYSIEALNTAIQSGISAFGDTATNIVLSPNYASLKVDITLVGGYQIDFSYNDLYYLVGFPKAILTVSSSGSSPVNITLGVTSWIVSSNIVSPESSFSNGISSSSLYNFSPNQPAGSLLNLTPNNLLYLPLASTTISRVNITLTDQSGNRLSQLSALEPTSFTLVIRSD